MLCIWRSKRFLFLLIAFYLCKTRVPLFHCLNKLNTYRACFHTFCFFVLLVQGPGRRVSWRLLCFSPTLSALCPFCVRCCCPCMSPHSLADSSLDPHLYKGSNNWSQSKAMVLSPWYTSASHREEKLTCFGSTPESESALLGREQDYLPLKRPWVFLMKNYWRSTQSAF